VGSATVIFSGSSTAIDLPFGNPVFSWAIRMDPLSAFFKGLTQIIIVDTV
jgi:hypothetical protein